MHFSNILYCLFVSVELPKQHVSVFMLTLVTIQKYQWNWLHPQYSCSTGNVLSSGNVPLYACWIILYEPLYELQNITYFLKLEWILIANLVTRQLLMGAGNCQWGGYTARNVWNIHGELYLAFHVLASHNF